MHKLSVREIEAEDARAGSGRGRHSRLDERRQARRVLHAQIHLHMWEKNLRGKGLGAVLFCLSALKFIKDFKLRALYCQPKHDNPMPSGMLRKLGCALLNEVDWKRPGTSLIVRQNRYLVSEEILHKYLTSAQNLFSLWGRGALLFGKDCLLFLPHGNKTRQ